MGIRESVTFYVDDYDHTDITKPPTIQYTTAAPTVSKRILLIYGVPQVKLTLSTITYKYENFGSLFFAHSVVHIVI